MRKMLIILISTVVTALNINSYGELNNNQLQEIGKLANSKNEITIEKSINLGLGSTLFKLIHFAELMFLSEIGRRRLIN